PGVFVAGAFRSPGDIPQAVMEGSSAAAGLACLVKGAGGQIADEVEYPGLGDSDQIVPKIGVFLCDSGRGVLSLAEIGKAVRAERDVVHVEEIGLACESEGLREIRGRIGEKGINRVVIAGGSLMKLRRAAEKMAREAGFSPEVFEYANIDEQCASVHSNDPPLATEKAKVLVRSAVARARWVRPVRRAGKEVVRRVLVVGGGLAGLAAALGLAEQGIEVTLAEKEESLGGNGRFSYYTLQGSDSQSSLEELIARVEAHPRIEVWKGAELESLDGSWGDFRTRFSVDGEAREARHGAIILATGAHEMRPREYLYGEDPRVFTQRELERMVHEGDRRLEGLRAVAMIQCVGSRDEQHPYCSRICCGQAVKNALKLKRMNPDLLVVVLYRDVRTYGFYETSYEEARNQGVIFVRYEPDNKPRVACVDDALEIRFDDPVAGEQIRLEIDLLVLSVGIEANDNRRLAEKVGVELDADGFFKEVNSKSAPLDSVDRGKFFCGLCLAPCSIEDSIVQGRGAAMRAAVLLANRRVEYKPYPAYVIERLCSGCGLCITTCPYGARVLDEETWKARVLEDLCQGCGNCVVACRNGASQQLNYEKVGVLATLDAAIE
ncbi:MAG: CoB--CoM heterodisulfide reductase iron-sulfur subunit A family protein, partial [Deltaproteobacteria bacterium]|nr:CoB--CoM heterodisulfide reductase iron-sulfur subunit A family protein [Deltaproteobacteria bacterium]